MAGRSSGSQAEPRLRHWKLVGPFPAAIAAIGTLAIPVVGVFAGALLPGEAAGRAEVAALVPVCLGLAVVLVGPAALGNHKTKPV